MIIWKKPYDLELLNAVNEGRADGVLGISITEVGADFVRAEMAVERRTQQPYGLLHGGVSCVLAETVGSIASMLACDEHHYVVGVEINATHLSAVRSGKIVATARPLKIGRRLQTWSVDIVSEAQRPVCAARLTTAVLPVEPADD
jgi:uncharacterized protein (TIGR00369 family)